MSKRNHNTTQTEVKVEVSTPVEAPIEQIEVLTDLTQTEESVPEFKVARATSLRGKVAAHMKEHATSPMLAVLPGIQKILEKDGKEASLGAARHFYAWIVENGYGPGTPEKLPRTPKAPVEKTEQVAA